MQTTTSGELHRRMAHARKARDRLRRTEVREQARDHAKATKRWSAARENYARVRRQHGEDSPEEKAAFRRLMEAEAAWFKSHPRAA